MVCSAGLPLSLVLPSVLLFMFPVFPTRPQAHGDQCNSGLVQGQT